jgi:hypothetical protein
MMIRKNIFARITRRKGRARCITAILLNFLAGAPATAAQKDGQDLPVRQTLPPGTPCLNSVKTQQNRANIGHSRWHGPCDSLCGTMYSDRSK